jgi:SAM-dependent methyltransferase
MRVLDIGCGPGSITAGLAGIVDATGVAVGIDLDPERLPEHPRSAVAAAHASRLPFPDATFDAMFSCALLQHVDDPLAVLVEARRVAKPGSVIGIADADWDGWLVHPPDPLVDRGQQILRQLRSSGDPTVGKRLRGLLTDAGFERCTQQVSAVSEGDAGTVLSGAFRAASFEAPAAVALVEDRGWSSAAEMAAIAAAWRRWGESPGAVFAGFWCEALGWVGE